MKSAKNDLFGLLANLARALGHPHRLALIELVAQGERSVDRLAQLTGLSVANASQHLRQLLRAGLVQCRRKGNWVLYALGDGPIVPLLAALRDYGEHSQAEVRSIVNDYFQRLDHLEPVSRIELLARIKERSVTVLDVRPADEFDQGHLPGALNVPIDELAQRLAELPKLHEIVAYCRGPYCIMSFEAVALLRAKGYRARRLEDGLPEWRAAGFTIQR